MHVIVNVQPLTPPLTGIGYYTRELTLRLLQGDAHGQELRMQALSGERCEPLTLEHPLLGDMEGAAQNGAPGVKEAGPLWRLARRYLRNPLTRRAYRWVTTERLKRHSRRLAARDDALYWEPNYVLLPWQGKSVLTVHDLSHERYPEYHPTERVEFFNRYLGESLQRATRINVVSQFTANELHALHGVEPGRIDIVPPGVAERFFQLPKAQHKEALVSRYQLPPRYLLSVGTLEPRKNLARVLEAFAGLPQQQRKETPLLLAGMPGWGELTLSSKVRTAMAENTIRRLGYVASEDLPGLYALATGFVYVSLYEGFGMPIIEAMASGTPVLTANVSATAEVAGDAALTVDPESVFAIGHGLQRLLEDEHGRMIERARGRAAEFSWEASANRLRRSFQHTLEMQ